MNVMVVHYVHSINIININLGYASLMVVPANAVTPIISNVTHPQQAAPSCVGVLFHPSDSTTADDTILSFYGWGGIVLPEPKKKMLRVGRRCYE